MNIRRLLASLLLAFCCLAAAAQSGLSRQQRLVQKNFPLLFRLQTQDALSELVENDATLVELGAQKLAAFSGAASEEASVQQARFSDEEIARAGKRFAYLSTKPAFRELAAALRKAGTYYIYNGLPNAEFLKKAWEQDARGISNVIDVYGLGKKPHYAAIDSIDFDAQGQELARLRATVRENVCAIAAGGPFYCVPLHTALSYIDISDRYEAVDFEPMEEGINKSAYEAVARTDWNKYPYTVILILGQGPEREGEAISPGSRLRARYAAELYRQGKAPFLVTSGGRVHPYKTPFSEADQMKRYLVENCGIPEEAVIAEPHARHTTTNIRNTVRSMGERGIPLDRPGLITSGSGHVNYVCKEGFVPFCEKMMYVVPFRLGRRLDGRTVEFHPQACATQVAPIDPLDP